MPETSLALIADIHGNTWALDAVLADIDRRGIAQIINLGDCAYGALDQAGTLARLMERAIPTVSGNQDRIVHTPPPELVGSPDQTFITARITPTQVAGCAICRRRWWSATSSAATARPPQMRPRCWRRSRRRGCGCAPTLI